MDKIIRDKYSRSEARRVWETIGSKKIPVDPHEIAKALEIEVVGKYFEQTPGCAGLGSDGTCLIVYNNKDPLTRQRFTLAHEIGHVILEHIVISGLSSQNSKSAQESEANTFAGELLVPSGDLKQFLKGGNNSFEDVQKRYVVSPQVATIAINSNRLLMKLKI